MAKVKAHVRGVGDIDSRPEDAVTAALSRVEGTLKHSRTHGCVA